MFELDDGTRLLYSDQRRFGTMRLVGAGELDDFRAARVGPEPLQDGWTAGSAARARCAGGRHR